MLKPVALGGNWPTTTFCGGKSATKKALPVRLTHRPGLPTPVFPQDQLVTLACLDCTPSIRKNFHNWEMRQAGKTDETLDISGVNHHSPWKAAFLRKKRIEAAWQTGNVPARELIGHDDHVVTCLQFDGNRIVSGSDDNTLKVRTYIRFSVIMTLDQGCRICQRLWPQAIMSLYWVRLPNQLDLRSYVSHVISLMAL